MIALQVTQLMRQHRLSKSLASLVCNHMKLDTYYNGTVDVST